MYLLISYIHSYYSSYILLLMRVCILIVVVSPDGSPNMIGLRHLVEAPIPNVEC